MGLLRVVWDTLSQRFAARHVPARLTLPHLPNLTVMITGATSGIGLHTASLALALAGAHVVLAVRNTNAAKDLISQWQPQGAPLLHCEVMELDCLSFDSVRKLAEAWKARKLPLHLLINNAGIFCMTGARSVLFCATDKQVQDHARRLRGFGYPLAPYYGPDLKIWSVGSPSLGRDTQISRSAFKLH